MTAMLILCGGAYGVQAHAQQPDEDNHQLTDEKGTWSLVVENDYFGDSDDNYTNGLRLSWMSGSKPMDPVSRFATNLMRGDDAVVVRRGLAIGQSVFTPNDLQTTEYLPDQRPYAAWLYGEFTNVVERSNTIDQLTIQLGVVGPSAGGEWAQEEIHNLIEDEAPQGWDNQIKDEVGVVISYDKKMRALAKLGETDFGIDITPNLGVTLGNIYTNARAGLTVRIGQDLKNDYGPPRVRPSLAGSGYFAPDDGFSWYIFGGVEGRAVAHDIFLEGSLFRTDDPSVVAKDFVADLQAGLVLQFGQTQIGLTYIERTEEYETQDIPQRFGAVSLSRKF
ncbi:MAG: hypothetical protein CME88_16230 [Hirschia sp.]|nr:hypothetical protein [Hirschia sp.]MBF19925.1 hypothetical protein [Hirschia sp.]|tara:strand:- start:314 stop:1315 length:1002 start_codon:yes stop_codon:yes gene_type:complete